MSTEGDPKLTIELYKNNNGIEFAINRENIGWFIGPNGESTFTELLNKFFNNHAEFSEFLVIYNNYRKHTGVRGAITGLQDKSKTMFSSIFNRNTPKSVTKGSDSLLNDDEQTKQLKGLLGGKKTKSKRSYNSNKTLKNRK